MANIFNSIQVKRPQKNVFDLTHDHKLTCQLGQLVPTMCLECIPGDKFDLSTESLVRFQPLVAPMMHRTDVSNHYFFVPYRLVWPNWDKFISNTKDGVAIPAFPTMVPSEPNYTRLLDHLGIPFIDPGMTPTPVSAMPLAAYQLIYNEYYRDQNLIPEVDYELNDGDNTPNTDLLPLRQRAWEHDYFTSALPWAQKGDAVSVPLGDFKDVPVWQNVTPSSSTTLDGTPTDITVGLRESADSLDPIQLGQLYAETSSLEGGGVNVNDLRRATKLQEWLELFARAGSRLTEMIWAFFGVKSPDARLQRPEYITGSKTPIIVSDVLQNSETATTPQANPAGYGMTGVNGRQGSYYVQEHGFIMCITSVTAKTAYQQGVEKFWLKTTDATQYFFNQFAHIGEQEVHIDELYWGWNAPVNLHTFGYVPRYAEYKFMNNRVSGEMRTNLAFWHLGRVFGGIPTLSQEFIEQVPRRDVFAVTNPEVDTVIMHILHKIKAVRGMPKFGTPHF